MRKFDGIVSSFVGGRRLKGRNVKRLGKAICSLEMLEGRFLMSTTYVVNTTGDPSTLTNGTLSLRQAITAANGISNSTSTIEFSQSVFTPGTLHTITLSSASGHGVLVINENISIEETYSNVVAVSGDNTAIFRISSGITASISELDIEHGNAEVDGGNLKGGGIDNRGTLTLTSCTLSGNTATFGGGIYSSGSLTVTDCTIEGSQAGFGSGGYGGGIDIESGTAAISESTISGNGTGKGNGGGIYNLGSLTLTDNCIVTNNFASVNGGGIANGGVSINNITHAGGTVTLTNSIVSGNTASGFSLKNSGGGIYSTGALAATGCTVDDNSAAYGGGIANGGIATNGAKQVGGTVTLTNSSLSGNTASGANDSGGGGIYSSGKLTATGCTIDGDSSHFDGGGILNKNNGNINNGIVFLNGGMVENCTTVYFGGGVKNDGTMNIYGGCVISGDSCINPGGANRGYGGGVLNGPFDDTITISNSIIKDNTASFGGGGLENDGNATVSNDQIYGNSVVVGDGGGIRNNLRGNYSVTLALSGSNVYDNMATGNGGGVAIENATTATLVQTNIYNDTASGGNGGGVANFSVIGAIQQCNIYGDSCTTTSQGTKGYGGGIYNIGTITKIYSSSQINTDVAGARGGGIDNGVAVGPGGGTTNHLGTISEISGCEINGDSTATNNANADGGGIYNLGTISSIDSSSQIENDKAGGNGGGIFNNGGTLFIVSSQISGNTAIGGTASFDHKSQGGGIDNRGDYAGGYIYLGNDTINSNTSYGDGGGIFNNFNQQVTISGGQIEDNDTGEFGGGMKNDGFSTIVGCTIMGNVADDTLSGNGAGGGLVNGDGSPSTLTVTNSKISNNTALQDGGGIESFGETSLTGDTISGNVVIGGDGISRKAFAQTTDGGGIGSVGSTLTVMQCNVSGNAVAPSVTGTFEYAGGGIYSSSPSTIVGDTVSRNTVGNSSSVGANGGGIFIAAPTGDDVMITGCEISGDSVLGGSSNGGGLYNRGYVTMESSTISGDVATDTNATGIFNIRTLIMEDSSSPVSGVTVSDTIENNSNLTVLQTIKAEPVTIGALSGTGTLTVGDTGGTTPGYLIITAGSGTCAQNALNINTGSTMDMTNNAFLIKYANAGDQSPEPTVQHLLYTGYALSAWDGTGIISSWAALYYDKYGLTLGYVDGSLDASVIGGITVPAGQLLIEYALAGDSNLDGSVNLTDLFSRNNHYGETGQDWASGDYNYDGSVNLTDLLIQNNDYAEVFTAVNALSQGGSTLNGASYNYTSVELILVINGDGFGDYVPGDFAVYAEDSSNNSGIAALAIEISGDGFNVQNMLPQGEYSNGLTGRRNVGEVVGFTQYNSGYSYSVSGSTIVSGSQDTMATRGVALVYGMGQMAGSLPSVIPSGQSSVETPTSPDYQAELLVATGTYTAGSPPTLEAANSSANVFVSTGSAATEAANIVLVTETLTG